LLVAVTIHALLGVRSVLFDFDLAPHARRHVDLGEP
jgi:succinate dehydrogenase hydrophobic anchor subunit